MKQLRLKNERTRFGLLLLGYPDWYYPLFGYWLKGSAGAEYEFPANALYYHPLPSEN